ncbi:MAG: flagellar biosynthesis protein FlhF, partial [Desulfuromonadales bacterium]|nr:flagellar biosynthesis protein FlhF [Desulfuromonadales bacterium]
MLVRKFEAENMAAALNQVKKSLGPEALILSTRTLGKKGLGVLGKQTIEVTAAIESPAMKSNLRQAVPSQERSTATLGTVS